MNTENVAKFVFVAFLGGILLGLFFYDIVLQNYTPFGINELIEREIVQYNKTSGNLEWVEKNTITVDND